MSNPVDIAILGAGGRMGRALIQAVAETGDAVLVAAIEQGGHADIGKDSGMLAGLPANGVLIGADAAALAGCRVAIEFSTPSATVRHAALAAKHGVAYIAGTTGLAQADEHALQEAARQIPVVHAANFSVGMNLLADLVGRAAARLGPDFDIEILEMHHHHKIDAPSGSALMLGHAAAAGRHVHLNEVAERGRDGVTGPRRPGAIGFAALRGGDVAGDHTVFFTGEGERLELTHRAGGRGIFARGAVRAALWAINQPPGLYSMRDVLGLNG
jgi:4-hydroxy-tetrahydrodipicolinate reductase